MGLSYGPKGTRVGYSAIDSVTLYNITLNYADERNGGFEFSGYHTTGGCGNPDSGVLIKIKDFIPWNRISMEFWLDGTAACWSFMNTSQTYGSGAGTDWNMIDYDSSVDRFVRLENSFDYSPSFVQKTSACDNNSNNFFHGSYGYNGTKKFVMTRRRNSMSSLGGIHHGRSCNSTGAGSQTVIKNIYVWYQ